MINVNLKVIAEDPLITQTVTEITLDLNVTRATRTRMLESMELAHMTNNAKVLKTVTGSA